MYVWGEGNAPKRKRKTPGGKNVPKRKTPREKNKTPLDRVGNPMGTKRGIAMKGTVQKERVLPIGAKSSMKTQGWVTQKGGTLQERAHRGAHSGRPPDPSKGKRKGTHSGRPPDSQTGTQIGDISDPAL